MIEFNFDKNDGEGDSNEDKLPSLDKDESKCSSQSRTEGKNTFFSSQWQHQISSNYSEGSQQTIQGTTNCQLFGGKMLEGTLRGVPLCG